MAVNFQENLYFRLFHIFFIPRIPNLFHSFSDFIVYLVMTLIFPKNQRQCASFSINMAVLLLSFKQATTMPNKLVSVLVFSGGR